MSKRIKVGLIGYGYWGPNVARNFHQCPRFELARLADSDSTRRAAAREKLPGVVIDDSAAPILTSPDIDAVAVMTPVASHYDLVKTALLNKKHVIVGKPLTASSVQARELCELADQQQKILMVDTTFLFTPAVKGIKDYIDNGELGEIFYIDSVRVNLGLFQSDVDVLWDLAPHDLSILDYLLGKRPRSLSATGADHFATGMADMAYLTLFYDHNLIAHLHVNWLSPIKIRKTLIGGSRKMLVWDDLDQEAKIKIYDKGVQLRGTEGKYQSLAQYRIGDMIAPALSFKEALLSEIEYFADCISSSRRPINDGRAGMIVVETLEAAGRSLANQGQVVSL